MTSKQKAAIKYNLKKKWLNWEITKDEYDDLVDQLQVLATAGASLQDANQALGLTKGSKPKTTPQTVPKPAAPSAASGGMTPEEYKKQKSILFKKVQAGEMTNYAYIQWKKQNDPSKNPAGASSASSKMTMNDLQDISTEIAQKFSNGEITLTEYDELTHQLNDLYWGQNDKSPAEVKKMLGLTTGASASAKAATGMTAAQEKDILDFINTLATNGDIEHDDVNDMVAMVKELKKNGIGQTLAKNAVVDAVQMMNLNGMTALEATMNASAGAYYQAQNPTPSPAPTVANNAGANAATQAEDKLTKELKKVYKQAADELNVQLKEFTDRYGIQLAEMQAKVAAGEMTQAELQAWISGKDKIAQIMKARIEQMSDTMLNANQKAAAMVNGETFGVFAENANYQSYQITQNAKLNLSFAVYDEDSVRRLIMDKPELLPRKIVNGKKDKAWNQKKIAAAVTQGILQGQSIPSLARRIATDTGYDNMTAMLRYARTAMTGAQNAGRMEALQRAKGMGIKVKKTWLATLDSRTRDSHQKMDGETVDVEAKFSNGLMHPGDLNGAPGEIWNCRCTMVYEYEGFESDPAADQRIQYDDYYTTYKDKDGKKHKVYHRSGSSLVTNMNYGEWKAAKQSSKLNDLNQAKVVLANAQKSFIKYKVNESKVYSDLWKDDVTLADYPAKAATIAAKRDYYTAEIDKLNAAIANGESWAKPEKVKELEKKRKLLNEFQLHGQILQTRNNALKAVQDIYDQVGLQKTATAPTIAQPKAKKAPKTATGAAQTSGGTSGGAKTQTAPVAQTAAQKGQFAPDAWDAKKKKAAVYYEHKKDADKVLRKELDGLWDNLTEEEKYAVWEYTANSNLMNKRLSGYGDTRDWSRKDFVGFGNSVWGLEDSWRYLPKEMEKFGKDGHSLYHKAITKLTTAIEKSKLDRDMWFKRQGGAGDFAGMMEGGGFKFEQVFKMLDGNHSQADLDKAFVGQRGKNNAFTSVGIAKDARWSGNIWYNIYAPKGTKGIYAEPQSHYGDSMGGRDKIYKKGSGYTSVGNEAEVIMQRGTEYRILAIRQKLNRYGDPEYEVDMEIVAQPDYFQYGDEDTYNSGKTRHKK